jgi:hypothetical protein
MNAPSRERGSEMALLGDANPLWEPSGPTTR